VDLTCLPGTFVSWYWVLWVMARYFLLLHTGTFLNRNLKDFGENENTRKTYYIYCGAKKKN
jgi:hypothetical protein